MNVQEYIDSGILHDYAMGMLSETEKAGVEELCVKNPEIQEELKHLRESIETYAEESAIWPGKELQENIWSKLDNINRENTGDINQLPIVNKYSDYNNWKRIVMPFVPKEFVKDRIMTTIRHSGGVKQILVMSKTDVEEEVHENEQESFIILEGDCECHIGAHVYRLGPGSFIEIPMHTSHNVRVLSPYVMAVLQHVAV